jgi:multiple sugar transport system substrate-binding protein
MKPDRASRRRRVAWLPVLCAALVTAACGSSSPAKQSGPVTITFYTEPLNTTPVVQDLVTTFEQSHPGIHVKLVVGPTNVDTVRGVLTTQISSGSASPDVYEGDVTWPAQFAKNNLAVNLSQNLPSSFWTQFAPGLLNAANVHGSYYMVPWITEAGYFYYRKDLLAAHHLPVPRTWEEVASDSKQLQSAGQVKYGYVWQGAPYEGLTCDLVELVNDAGGQVVNSSYTKPDINSAAAAKAVGFLRSSITSGVSPQAVTTFQEPQALNTFDAGSAAFMRGWGYAWAITQDKTSSSIAGKVGVAPMPTFAGQSYPGASTVGGGNLYINPHTKNLDADLTFIKWLSGTQAQTMVATIGKVLPVTSAVQGTASVRAIDPPLAELANLRIVARPTGTANYAQLSQALYQNGNSALNGSTSIASALNAASGEVASALAGSLG